MKKNPSIFAYFALASLTLGALLCQAQAQTLLHRYSFNDASGNGTCADSIGGPSWSGTLIGSASLDGSMLQLDGSGWIVLPGGIMGGSSQLTVEFWGSFSSLNPFWTRVFAFGNQDGNGAKVTGLDYCHYANGDWQNLSLTTAIADVWANNPGGLNGRDNVHVTVVVDPVNNQMYYYNGTAIASNPGINNGAAPPLSGVNDAVCLIGKSLFDVDAPLTGSVDEFRVYEGVLSPSAVALNDAAGPDNYVISPGALQTVHLTSPDNPLLVNQVSQQIFTGDFANVSGVNLISYGGATFTSANNAILTVNSSGRVTAMTPGITTLVASFGGRSVTNTLTVQAPVVLTSRSGSNLLLRWPAAAAGFSLQSRSNLSSGSWNTLTNVPVHSGTNWQVTVSTAGGPQFFRLWH